MRTWRTVLLGIVCVLLATNSVRAGVPPAPPRTPLELTALFPSAGQLSTGLVLQDSGERTESEIAVSFRDPADATAILHTTDWAFNAYQVYAGAPGAPLDTPIRLEISLHQFSTGSGAAYALPYFVHGRAVILGLSEVPPWDMGSSCAGAVVGDYEVTLYRRIEGLLIRVTAVMPSDLPSYETYTAGMKAAGVAITATTTNAGSSQLPGQTCQ